MIASLNVGTTTIEKRAAHSISAFDKRMDERDAWELGLMLASIAAAVGAFEYLERRPGGG